MIQHGPSHPLRLVAPFYAPAGQSGLHRYLDPDFINRFRQDVLRRSFDKPQFSAWIAEDSPTDGGEPVLRLPLHKTFHVFCCEIVCDRIGQPALDPDRIRSAGFVIRRVGADPEQAWMVEDGVALGWQAAATEQRDPDLYRRLCASGIVHRLPDPPAYNGEETHPLHVLNATDAGGRRHTLLFGYLPLGGSYYLRRPLDGVDDEARRALAEASDKALPWPFGYRDDNRSRRTAGVRATPVDRFTSAGDTGTQVVHGGVPGRPMFELLRLLVSRYHLGESGIADNEALLGLCDRLVFDVPDRPAWQPSVPDGRVTSLGGYLRACFARGGDNPLVAWIARQEQVLEAAADLPEAPPLHALPMPDGQSGATMTLVVGAADAQEMRELLGQRLLDQSLAQVREIPLPKFDRGDADLFQIVPFVRALDDDGCERLHWAEYGARSPRFRVATPFDPEASRPALIQMPAMSDLKRGVARGVSMITPADTFAMMNSLKLSKGASPDALPEDAPGGGNGLQWVCSFSLPVITLVAMILLMIMVSILNLLFFWMPWVRICLPLPKIKGGPSG